MRFNYDIWIDVSNPGDCEETCSIRLRFADERRCMTMGELYDVIRRFICIDWIDDFNECPTSEGHILALDEVHAEVEK